MENEDGSMKRMRIFSLVVGLHVAVVGLIFIVPACHTTPVESGGTEGLAAPMGGAATSADPTEREGLHPSFNAGMPVASSSSVSGPRHSPTRPEEVLSFAPMETEEEILTPLPVSDVEAMETMTTYVVERGDSLWGITRRHGMALQDLLEANGFDRQTTIYPGQSILIPSYPEPSSESGRFIDVEEDGGEEVALYTVGAGDTLSEIAERFGITTAELKGLNDMGGDTIFPGQTIQVPAGAYEWPQSDLPESEVSVPPLAEGDEGVHVVQAGETPSGIARRYGMSTEEFMRINEIADPRRLRVGQSVIVRILEPEQFLIPSSLESRLDDSAAAESEETAAAVAPEIEPTVELPPSLVELEGLPFESEEDIPVIPIESEEPDEEETEQE